MRSKRLLRIDMMPISDKSNDKVVLEESEDEESEEEEEE